MKVTEHAKNRMKERCGLNKKSKDRIVQKVFHEGIRHCETKGRLNKWVTSLWGRNKSANEIRLYGGKAYIFCGETLVTVLPIPPNLMKDFSKMTTKKEKTDED